MTEVISMPGSEEAKLALEAEVADESVNYSSFIGFGPSGPAEGLQEPASESEDRDVAKLEAALEDILAEGVQLRGIYDTTLTSSCDHSVLIWLRSDSANKLQQSYRKLRRIFTSIFQVQVISTEVTVELTEPPVEPLEWVSLVDSYVETKILPEFVGEVDIPRVAELVDASYVADAEEDDVAAIVSLHAPVGISLEQYTIVAEAEDAQYLVGDPSQFIEEIAGTVSMGGALITGRLIKPADVFEVLR